MATNTRGAGRSEVYYQVWLDGAPYQRGKHFLDTDGAWALRDRIAGRISERQASIRCGVMMIDETGNGPIEPRSMPRTSRASRPEPTPDETAKGGRP